ncbi:uncharacterized protein N7496_005915 [Penicillium cataractarum]|uniref:Uncharacterized protein n=1 Tax=Penicillium cataractarum TaxID=2100454 RepID=A0A9W9S585_9EURO|nr:uncharacterized protein N7496_005915 [Penicillium cataractarum]KAJ5369823.1 hypothetical protein N7496_005915 [Penicillium cataractarum]
MKFSAILFAGIVTADTLTVSFFQGQTCDNGAVQTFKIGEIHKCHATQSVGALRLKDVATSFFHRDLVLKLYTNSDCSGRALAASALSNSGKCANAPQGVTFSSFQITENDGQFSF